MYFLIFNLKVVSGTQVLWTNLKSPHLSLTFFSFNTFLLDMCKAQALGFGEKVSALK